MPETLLPSEFWHTYTQMPSSLKYFFCITYLFWAMASQSSSDSKFFISTIRWAWLMVAKISACIFTEAYSCQFPSESADTSTQLFEFSFHTILICNSAAISRQTVCTTLGESAMVLWWWWIYYKINPFNLNQWVD